MAQKPTRNTLYYGDNLPILRGYIADESVDLVYLDPPFNSKATYNILFEDHVGARSTAQLQAFKDTWSWDEAVLTFQDLSLDSSPLGDAIRSFGTLLQKGGMLAYLTMMAPRLKELHRVLKPTGSIYLHCDPTASHYLKIVMDAIFGPKNFRNEIVWRRSHPKGHAFTRFATNHDTILSYTKSAGQAMWNAIYRPYDPETITSQYNLLDEDGRRYQLTSLLNPNPDRPNLTYEFKGVTKVWRWTKDRMLEQDKKGRIIVPKEGRGIPRYKRFLDEQEGIPVDDFWGDVELVSGSESLGYPTQKPEALLERIIKASSNEGDVVLDPFCGCGTATVVAQRLNRQWIGIDITQAAIVTIKQRLQDTFGNEAVYKVIGEPTVLNDAIELARENPYQFQWWASGLVGARPAELKKGSDKGIDARLFFIDAYGKPQQIIIQVKAGNTGVAHVHELRGVIEREKAAIGVLLIISEPTKPMKVDAGSAGYYESQWGKHPRIQILTVGELLQGKKIDYPPSQQVNVTYKKASKAKGELPGQLALGEEE